MWLRHYAVGQLASVSGSRMARRRSLAVADHAVDCGAGRVALTDIGQGPTLLVVHVGSWSFVPGCGLSDHTEDTPTLIDASDALKAVVDQLQLRDVTLVAHELVPTAVAGIIPVDADTFDNWCGAA